jgi:SAM-dependent methyltransferase
MDAAVLSAAGFDVVGFDVVGFDRAELSRAHTAAPRVALLRADFATPLPFRTGAFDAAVSSLALHYLPWAATRAAYGEIHRVLRPGAPFLFRVNAFDDLHHGAGQGDELEPGFFRVPLAGYSDTKRFFDDAMVRAALDGWFEIEHLAHGTIHRYEQPKRVWICLARSR